MSDEASVTFPKSIETGEKAEDALPHLFDIWHFDRMPHLNHATRYIRLNYPDSVADIVESRLQTGVPSVGRADDILRSCRLYPAPLEDPLVREHLSHLTNGKKFRPLVMIMFNDGRYAADIIDGYHRLSVAWWCDAQIACPFLKVTI